MRKFIFTSLYILLLLSANVVLYADTSSFKEGVNYVVLDMPKVDNTVWKIYSVYCPFCNKYEKSVTPYLIKNLPSNVQFEGIFLSSKGQYGEDAAKVLAVAKVIGDDEYEAVKKVYYYEANENKEKNIKNKGNDNYIDIGLKAANIGKEQYNNLLSDPRVTGLLDYWRSLALPIATVNGGVPAIVVNGKYLIKTDSIKSQDMLIDLTLYLLSK